MNLFKKPDASGIKSLAFAISTIGTLAIFHITTEIDKNKLDSTLLTSSSQTYKLDEKLKSNIGCC